MDLLSVLNSKQRRQKIEWAWTYTVQDLMENCIALFSFSLSEIQYTDTSSVCHSSFYTMLGIRLYTNLLMSSHSDGYNLEGVSLLCQHHLPFHSKEYTIACFDEITKRDMFVP